AHPPLPTAWNFPFHRDEGSQISILMSESADGVSVAATRENAGSDAYTRGTGGGAPPCRAVPGGVNAPGATSCAIVILVLSSVRRARDSQVAAYDARGKQRLNST